MRRSIVTGLICLLALSACATPNVDQTAATFSELDYSSDLDTCRGGAFLVASAKTLGIAMLGSAYGALEGAHIGARDGDTAEGAAIGAIIGGTIGLTSGAFKALEEHEAEITNCMVQKGYHLAG